MTLPVLCSFLFFSLSLFSFPLFSFCSFYASFLLLFLFFHFFCSLLSSLICYSCSYYCNHIEKLIESLNQVMAANEKITSDLLIIKNVNVNQRTESLIWKSCNPNLSNIIEGTILKYQEFQTKYLKRILKTMLSRFVKIPTL